MPVLVAARAAEKSRPDPSWQEDIRLDKVFLFRYSALAINRHRIHYDFPFATKEEAYPALVLHGPLRATLLASLVSRRNRKPFARVGFRGKSPAFCGMPLLACGTATNGGAKP